MYEFILFQTFYSNVFFNFPFLFLRMIFVLLSYISFFVCFSSETFLQNCPAYSCGFSLFFFINTHLFFVYQLLSFFFMVDLLAVTLLIVILYEETTFYLFYFFLICSILHTLCMLLEVSH